MSQTQTLYLKTGNDFKMGDNLKDYLNSDKSFLYFCTTPKEAERLAHQDNLDFTVDSVEQDQLPENPYTVGRSQLFKVTIEHYGTVESQYRTTLNLAQN